MNSKAALLAGILVVSTSPARADVISVTGVTQVLFGTVNLYSQNNSLISSKKILSVETGYDSKWDQISSVGLALGGSIIAQLGSDPQVSECPGAGCPSSGDVPIPAWVIAQLTNAVTPNGLGLNAGIGGALTPDPAQAAFDALALSQALPFRILSSTETVIDFDIPFTYATDFAANPATGFPGASVFVNVNFAEENVDEQVTAVPEASTWSMMILGFCTLGFLMVRKKLRKTLQTKSPSRRWSFNVSRGSIANMVSTTQELGIRCFS